MGRLFSELGPELGQAATYLADPLYWIAVFAAVFVAAFTGMIPGASVVLIMALSKRGSEQASPPERWLAPPPRSSATQA